MRTIILFACFIGTYAACANAQQSGSKQQASLPPQPRPIVIQSNELNTIFVVQGVLGVPLNEVVTITARAMTNAGKGDILQLKIFDVSGKRLPQSVRISYQMWPWANIKELETGKVYRLRGYETGGFSGIPVQAMKETTFIQTHGPVFTTKFEVINEVRAINPAKQ